MKYFVVYVGLVLLCAGLLRYEARLIRVSRVRRSVLDILAWYDHEGKLP
jgi:hypothetical protein